MLNKPIWCVMCGGWACACGLVGLLCDKTDENRQRLHGNHTTETIQELYKNYATFYDFLFAGRRVANPHVLSY